jgi:hypothetical protein
VNVLSGLAGFRRRHLGSVSLAVGLISLAVVACNGANATPPRVAQLTGQTANTRTPKSSPTPYTFKFETVNDPGSTSFTRITGIDELNQIVGTYGSGTTSDPSNGFTSFSPYTRFRKLDYPSALDTVATSMSSNKILAGYFVDDSQGHHTWGWIRNKGIWMQYKDPRAPRGAGSVTKFLGVSNAAIVAGTFIDDYGDNEAFEFANNRFHKLNPPGATSATANGINMRGVLVGTETTASGTTEGWFLENRTYYPIMYPKSSSTQALAVNYQEQVVGSYSGANGGGTHGFILINPRSPSGQFWQSIDEPKADGITVVTSINGHHNICGWYVDSTGRTNGFVATLEK